MELHKLKIDEIRAMTADRLKESEGELRRELALLKMDIATPGANKLGIKKGLKKNLARVKLVQTEMRVKK